MGCPSALVGLVCTLYDAVQGVIAIQGVPKHAFWIRSGIIQGDALSGSLFAAALSPALRDLHACFESKKLGINRACADDLGGALKAMQGLIQLYRVMN
eukprot:8947789-Pyramimonas_sp.AAC.1